MSWLPPLAKTKQKSCFQPSFTCKHDGESNHRKCHSGLYGTVSLGRALLSYSRAARSRASVLLAVLLCHITLVTLLCLRMFVTESLNSLSFCNSNFPIFPFFPLLWTFLLLPSLVPLVFINCHATRGSSFEYFHVAKEYFCSLLNILVFLEVFSTCSPHLVALNSDAFLSLSPIAKQQLTLPYSPL